MLAPESPETVVKRAETRIAEMQKSLPEFMSIFNRPTKKPKVRFYQGLEGLKQAYADYAVPNQPIYGFTDYEKMFETLPEDFLWQAGPEERVKNKCFFYCIAKDGQKGRLIQSKDQEQLRKTWLTKDVTFETEINIYSNKISLISFQKPYAAVIIEDKAIAQTMKSIWDMARRGLS